MRRYSVSRRTDDPEVVFAQKFRQKHQRCPEFYSTVKRRWSPRGGAGNARPRDALWARERLAGWGGPLSYIEVIEHIVWWTFVRIANLNCPQSTEWRLCALAGTTLKKCPLVKGSPS